MRDQEGETEEENIKKEKRGKEGRKGGREEGTPGRGDEGMKG